MFRLNGNYGQYYIRRHGRIGHLFQRRYKAIQTPVWVKEVKPGSHKLRVRRSKMDVYVETGKTLTLSYFKGSFIVVPEEKEVGKELASEPGKMAEGRRRVKPREVERPKNLTPWERFLNKTSQNF